MIDTLSADTLDRLRLLIEEVLRVNRQFNLTSVRDPEDAWNKHILDSLQGLQTGLFEGVVRVADVGAGAGFPGLPLSMARPQLKLVSIEATRKKCDFVKATGEKFGLKARAVCERAEVVGQNKMYRESFGVAVARAVGSCSEVCELTLPLVRIGGHAVLWRGAQANEELKAAQSAIKKLGGAPGQVIPYHLPGHTINYHLLVIPKTASTPKTYPRRTGLPKQQPL